MLFFCAMENVAVNNKTIPIIILSFNMCQLELLFLTFFPGKWFRLLS